MKPKFSLILIHARDWNLYEKQHTVNEKFEVSKGWINSYIVAAEYFPFENDEDGIRYIQAIPKEMVLFKKIIQGGMA